MKTVMVDRYCLSEIAKFYTRKISDELMYVSTDLSFYDYANLFSDTLSKLSARLDKSDKIRMSDYIESNYKMLSDHIYFY